MTLHHKVGQTHHYGMILADALKYDDSGHSASMYVDFDKSVIPYIPQYTVVEWNETGEYELSYKSYETREEADIAFLSLAFGVSL